MLYLSRSLATAGLALSAASLAAASPSVPASQRAEQVALRSPVTVDGLWCGAGLLRDFTLEIAQQYQRLEGRLVRRGKVREITGRVDGAVVRTDPQRDHTMELLAQGDELRIIGATGVLALAKGQFFTRAAGATCTH
ncbi:hypothetical protein [Ramlibacter pallidus]|uniref:DUF5666 domain-containing protein n=1 Tax=Ramlibacter pallidus TaxID=2780087 RepID=A0ABR9S4V8_9BURK|nr:hypothetical protein [Ramlibacter pallidus]MBE7368556.1 hypothetical protein [Ramlibacter pallidus]